MMQFPYTKYLIEGTSPGSTALLFRPMLYVRVFGPRNPCDIFARVDSGADDTILPYGTIGALGLNGLSAVSFIGGIGGRTSVRYTTVDLEINDGQMAYRWSAHVGFYASSLEASPPVLGLNGFLRFFTARFQGRINRLDLVPNDLAPPPSVSLR